MIDIISREVSSTDLKDVVNKLIPDSIARDIEKACQGEKISFWIDLKSDDNYDTLRRKPDPFDLHVRLIIYQDL